MPADRAGDEPGLTESLRYLGSESKLSAIGIGAYFVLHRFFNEVSNAVLGPLPLVSTAEVETIHPLVVAARTCPSCHGNRTHAAEFRSAYLGRPASRSGVTYGLSLTYC